MAEYKKDNKILLKDLNSVTDPSVSEFLWSERTRLKNYGKTITQQQGRVSIPKG